MTVLVTGATGFVGRAIVHKLRAQQRDVRTLVRSRARASQLESWGVELATGDVTDADSVTAAMEGCSHLIHLVSIIRGGESDFEQTMVAGTQNVIAAAREVEAERLILMSALGTSEETKGLVPYYGAKWRMEQAVEASGLEYVIFRPSFVFGKGGALPTFVRQVRLSPVVAVLGPGAGRLQPIWVDDVAAYFSSALDLPEAANRTFELGGPDVVSWNELYARIAKTLGKRRVYAHVPFSIARNGARLTEWIPGSPLTSDQVKMLEAGDNVVTESDAASTFGLPLVPLDEQLRRATSN